MTTTTKSMMKALAFTYRSDNVNIVDIERPEPEANEVQIQVEYAALDTSFDEVLNRTWTGTFVHKLADPLYLGWHYSGKVSSVGSTVQNLAVGDTVMGHLPHAPSTTNGTLAEYVVVPVEQCAKYNPNEKLKVDAATAAAATVEVNTAYQALRENGQLLAKLADSKAKPSVLVIGAAGGVGSAAVQIAHAMGAHVTATCRASDVDRVKAWGADVVWDRTSVPNPLAKKDITFDIIFDTPNSLSPSRAKKSLNKNGHYIATLPSLAFVWGLVCSLFSKKTVSMVEVKPVGTDLEQVGNWLANGIVKVDIDSTFAIKDMPRALQRQRQRGKKGRVVIQVANGWH